MKIFNNIFQFKSKRQRRKFDESVASTIEALSSVDTQTLARLTKLTLPEIEALRQEIAAIFPANNLPAYLLHGLTQLKGRRLPTERVQTDVLALFRSVSITGVYGSFIGGPAAILHGYQKLLELAGKDVDAAFPHGTWQFYVNFGLREDTARHTCETRGFQDAFPLEREEHLQATAWVAALNTLLCAYDDYLEMLWREPVLIGLALKVAGREPPPSIATMRQAWLRARPFKLPDGPYRRFVEYRRGVFDDFFAARIADLSARQRNRLNREFDHLRQKRLPAFQEQMSVLYTLKPERYLEARTSIPLGQARIGLNVKGHYYLLPVTRNGRDPLSLPTLQATVRQLLEQAQRQRTAVNKLDLHLVEIPRSKQLAARALLPPETQENLEALGQAPFLLHWTPRASDLPLAELRRTHRGAGDHALTLIRTPTSMVFDQSHIFFDGAWGTALAEIITNEAIAQYHRLERERGKGAAVKVQSLVLNSSPHFGRTTERPLPREVTAENDGVDLALLNRLRAWLRGRRVYLTVNDVLLLYRTMFPGFYRTGREVMSHLKPLYASRHAPTKAAALELKESLRKARVVNPSLLIPMDATYVDPRLRVYPTTFRNPFPDLIDFYKEIVKTQRAYRKTRANPEWRAFGQARNQFLSRLQAFSELLADVKAITLQGENFNVATIKLLAHMPQSIQRAMDRIPQHISSLNEVIKGEEVFSNVGRVAPGSSLTRFASAKDDGETKTLVWGIMTDDRQRLVITLRDFRPHVTRLAAVGQLELARLAVRDYLDQYVARLNTFNEVLLKALSRRGREQ
ncbi:MAG: hypothetical protein ACE5H9_02520 [Anaerolineae bacterium]